MRMIMADRKHRVALVGIGTMGKNHYRVLSESSEFEIVAVVEPNKELHNLVPKDLPLFENISSLNDSSYDIAIVAAPTEHHFEIGKFFIQKKKALFMEKPLASTYEQALELARLSKENHSFVAVGHVERANPAVRKIREVIKNGWLGVPIHYNFTRVGGYPANVKKGNNVLLDLAIHDLDILTYLEGGFKVKASVCHHSIQADIPDTAEILLSKEGGASANIHVNWITPTKIRTLRVTGTKGVCFVDYMLQTCVLWGGSLLDVAFADEFDYKDLQKHYRNSDKIEFGVGSEEPLKVQLRELDKALRGKKHALCLADEGVNVVKLAEEALQGNVS